MTLVYKDRVLETSATTGAGAYTLSGAVTGYQAFSAVGDGNTCYYEAQDINNDGSLKGSWEVGLGTYTLSGTSLARTSILTSSNSGNAVNWTAGTRQIALVFPASVATLAGSPGGSTTQLQYNNAGALGGITGVTYAAGVVTFLNTELQANKGATAGVCLGQSAGGTTNTDDSICIGFFAGGGLAASSSANQAVFLGRHAGYDAAAAVGTVCVGHAAGQYAYDSSSAVIIGYLAGRNANQVAGAHRYSSVIIGHSAAETCVSAQASVLLGENAAKTPLNASSAVIIGNAAMGATGASVDVNSCVAIGPSAGGTVTAASQSIMIGDRAGYAAGDATQSMYIGLLAGYSMARSHTLVIDNNYTYNQSGTTALIYGEFDTRALIFNAYTIVDDVTYAGASKAVFQLNSTTRGFLPPRMTTTQKNAISSPTEGLIVYDSTLHKLCVRTASTWETITSS